MKLINGDCMEELKKLPNNSVDLVVTDPPYNIGVNYGKNKDKLNEEDYYKWCLGWVKQCERVLKKDGSLYIINYPEKCARIMLEVDRNTNLELKRWINWHYPTNVGHSPKNFTRSSRAILFFTKGYIYKFNLKEGEEVQDVINMNLVKNVSKEKVKGFPNQIPEKLVELLVGLSSNERDVVLDPFLGSGTTGVVAKKMNRKFIGIELNKEFYELAEKRINSQVS